MTMYACRIAVLGALVSMSACEHPGHPPSEPSEQAATRKDSVIYGVDNRAEYYELTPGSDLQRLAHSSVALFDDQDVTLRADGYYEVYYGLSFASAFGLCSSEPYRIQPVSAKCSGFQVGERLIATAGHCVDDFSCGSTKFIFGYWMLDETTLRGILPPDDVYTCARVVARVEDATLDYAVVEVDRPIVGHEPLEIRREGAIGAGDPLAIVGHPVGLPLKVADGAVVRQNDHPYYFEANLDSYSGNSGSAVVDPDTLMVEGILVRGNTDFVRVGKGRKACYRSNVCSDAGCPGWEDVTRTTTFVEHVPPLGPQCVQDGDCDDGDPCNGNEICDAGQCVSGTPVDCNDGNACTTDACDPQIGQCVYAPVACDDGDLCTAGICDPVTGCDFTPTVCASDGDLCTVDACDSASGQCIYPPVDCDDGNVCTTDTCDAASGCIHIDKICGASDGCCPDGCGSDPDCGPVCVPSGGACSHRSDCCGGKCDRKKGVCK